MLGLTLICTISPRDAQLSEYIDSDGWKVGAVGRVLVANWLIVSLERGLAVL